MKRNFIKICTNLKEVNDKGVEALYKTYVSGTAIPFRKVMDAVLIEKKAESDEVSEAEGILEMFQVVCDLYENQFTTDDLMDGLHAPDAMDEIREQIRFFASGEMADQRKKELKALLK